MSDNRVSLMLPELPAELWQQLELEVDLIDRITIEGFDYRSALATVPVADFERAFPETSSTMCSREIPVQQ